MKNLPPLDLPPFLVWTPLGKASCEAVIWDTEDPQWLCWMLETGEPWWFGNKYVRKAATVTNGRPRCSPFFDINDETKEHIVRYKTNGWLPDEFDWSDSTTW